MKHLEHIGGFRLNWDDEIFPLSTDSVLLSDFATLRPRNRVCDLGCGAGVLPLLLLSRRKDLLVDGVELQPDAAHLARVNITDNKLEAFARIYEGDLRDVKHFLRPQAYDLVISNPPYFLPGSGKLAPSKAKSTARAELSCTVEELCTAARFLLRQGGRFALSFRPERLLELLFALSKADLEPKRLRFVHHRADKPPFLVLSESVRGGNPGLNCLPPLLVRERDGEESAELKRIYRIRADEQIAAKKDNLCRSGGTICPEHSI